MVARGEEEFDIPRSLIDQEASVSARQWDLALALADKAAQLTKERREEAHKEAAKKGRGALPAVLAAASSSSAAEEEAKRTRRPAAIMRQNVE
eukprot:1428224-Prymnesium_polylepis.1